MPVDPIPAAVPRLCGDLPGVGGRVKDRPEDFRVEEIPAYQPCGDGEHLFLDVEKTDLPAEGLLDHLAHALHVSRGSIGTAGMKDRRAVTRQWVSVPVSAFDRLDAVGEGLPDGTAVRVHEFRRHTNKLKTGHLRGNRFDVLLRGVEADAAERAAAVADRLRTRGFPNGFGDQRFGRDGETLSLGLALLRGERKPASIPPRRRKFLTRLALSAAQSDLFNRCLTDRLSDDTAGTVFDGDVLRVAGSGGLFVAADTAFEQSRVDAGETQVTGPLFGPKMKPPRGTPADREAAVLASAGLPTDAFDRYPKLTSGTRRAYLVRPDELETAAEEDGLRVRFTLPSGSYATVLLREFSGP